MKKEGVLKPAAGIALIVLAVLVLPRLFRHSAGDGEETAQVWYYNEGAKKLYAMPREAIPPDEKGVGVRAMVVTFHGRETQERKIAYLQSYSPDLKKMLEAAETAHQASQPFTGKIPAQGSAWFQDHTLVKRVDDADWSLASSADGRNILAEWRTWRGPNGEPPIVSVP